MRTRVRGVDVSMTAELEELGVCYRDHDGMPVDLFTFLAGSAVTTVRLRLWVDPYDRVGQPYLGGTNDLLRTLGLARRAVAAGLDVMLCLHYSDFWADPKKQSMPKQWCGQPLSTLAVTVGDYTRGVLTRFAAEGIPLAYVQIGNEITNGMLWPVGRTPKYLADKEVFEATVDSARQYDALAHLLQAGIAAVREVASEADVVLHLDFGGSRPLAQRWFAEIAARGTDWDISGLSYYPQWHGTLAQLSANIHELAQRYQRPVCVVETAYGHRIDTADGARPIFNAEAAERVGYPASATGQAAYLTDLQAVLAAVPEDRGLGFIYWEPGWISVPGTSWASAAGMAYGNDVAEPGNNWSNQAMFNADGSALTSWQAFELPQLR